MCQLLGMNCASPTDFSFSLKGFCRRGGATDIHSHGFGICVYEGRGVRSFHDTLPACQSPIAELVQNYPIRTYNMLAHIRYATQGQVSLENVHPFIRVWKGIQMTFCHNGDCPRFGGNNNNTKHNNTPPLLGKTRPETRIYHPVGDTDSEAVFCAILNALHAEFPDGLPTLPVLHAFLSHLCEEIIEKEEGHAIFNFLLGCGQYTQFAYSWPGKRPGSDCWNGLYYLVRQPPFSTARLLDVDYTIDFARFTTHADRVAVITTKPLTEEPGWTEFQRGELLMFDQGLPYRTPKCCERVEQQGRGLFSKEFVNQKCYHSPTILGISCKVPDVARMVLTERRGSSSGGADVPREARDDSAPRPDVVLNASSNSCSNNDANDEGDAAAGTSRSLLDRNTEPAARTMTTIMMPQTTGETTTGLLDIMTSTGSTQEPCENGQQQPAVVR